MKRFLKVLGILLITLIIFRQQGQAVEIDDIENVQPLFTNINVFQSTFDISSNGKSSNTVYLNSRNSDNLKLTHICNNMIQEDGQQLKAGQVQKSQLAMVLQITGM